VPRAKGRHLAPTWAIQLAREIVNTLFHDCGSMAVFEENPFERRLRDIDTVAEQGQDRILHYETVGQVIEIGHASLSMAPAGAAATHANVKYIEIWKKVRGHWRVYRGMWNARSPA
jgi:hypothetical protein